MTRFAPMLILLFAACGLAVPPPTTGPSKVSIDTDGITTVNGKRFFPIGCYVYELTGNVMADLHEHRINTVIGNSFGADQFDFIHQHGMMAVPFSTPEFLEKVRDHPSLLAWYLVDEPEGHGHTPESVKDAYTHLKAKDPNHPIGQCHFLFDAAAKFKEGSDFTMTDGSPVSKVFPGYTFGNRTSAGLLAPGWSRRRGPENWHCCNGARVLGVLPRTSADWELALSA